MFGLALVVLVGGLSLAVTTADGLRERRAAHAALTAMGIRAGVLRRSVLLQTALPLVLSVGLALGISVAASWLYLRLGAGPDEPPAPTLPWAEYGAVGVGAVMASLLATAAVLPFVRSAVRPESLRFE
jgi:predicted lysophospholipase L1 biosynthesis ABC-type transport system permease subunit